MKPKTLTAPRNFGSATTAVRLAWRARWWLLGICGVACREAESTDGARPKPTTQVAASAGTGRAQATPTVRGSVRGSGPDKHSTAEARSEQQRCVTLRSVRAIRLTEDGIAPGAEHSALRAARAELLRLLERPADFYAVLEGGADMVLVELWYEPGDGLDRCLSELRGSGKNRTLVYDPRARRIVSTSWNSRNVE